MVCLMPYYVYAIRLDRSAMGDKPSRAFRDQNWHIDWDYPLHDGCEYYYVGQSLHSPACRFEQHKTCFGDFGSFKCRCRLRKTIKTPRSNRYVRRFGLFLQPNFYDGFNPMRTRRQSEEAEKEVAGNIRELGHCAFWN